LSQRPPRLVALEATRGVYKLLHLRAHVAIAGRRPPGDAVGPAQIVVRDRRNVGNAILRESPRKRGAHTRAQTPALLKGLIFGPTGRAMTPAHTRKGGKLYRYYVSTDVLKRDATSCPIRRMPAAEIENAVIDQLRGLLRAPEIVVRTWKAARQTIGDISEAEVWEALERLDPLWDELFPAEQARIVQLLVERIDVSPDGADIRLRTEGLTNLLADLRAIGSESRRAA
jgi:site-specific DNA recombinase